MIRIYQVAGATAVAAALTILPIHGAALAHGEVGEHVAEFQKHIDEYAGDIADLSAMVESIVTDYEPGGEYADQLDALIEQWETVKFHQAVEAEASPLYPPIWAALGAFSTALEEDAPAETVRAKGEDITAALWQGYGALKLIATRDGQEHAAGEHEDEVEHGQASGAATIDTIKNNLDRVLALHKQGKGEAAQDLIFDTYMEHFEGIEGDLIEQDADLVSGLEADFNASLPELIKNGAPSSKVAERIEVMKEDLATARDLLASAEQEESSVF